MLPAVTRAPYAASAFRSDSPATLLAPQSHEPAELLWRTASTGVGAIKWAAAAGLLASVAGLGGSAVAACAAAGAAVGGIIWIGEITSLRQGWQLPHVTLQHGICNELHTLAGGLLGATPVAAGLTVLGAALATTASGNTALAGNGLAFLTAVVACPAAVLIASGARAASVDVPTGLRRLVVYGSPLLAVGAVLVVPTLALYAKVSAEAATRYVISFGVNMASAAVREALTQTTARAWSGLERNGVGVAYGLSQAQGADRAGSTVASTFTSCVLFAASTSLLMHQMENWTDLGLAPAGQSVLALSAAEAARRTALRSTLMQSTNELLEGIARCLPLAAYAYARGIPLRYRDTGAGLPDVPAQLRRNAADPATLRRAALFASARTLDGALSNVLSQLSSASAPRAFWTGYRIAAVLAQGATMARTPIVVAWLLPDATEAPDDDGDDQRVSTDRLDSGFALAAVSSDPVSASDDATATSSPLSDPSIQWA